MKICITAEGDSLDSQVDSRFGRCRYFLIYDTEKNAAEWLLNSNAGFSGGAGTQSAQLMASKGVEVVLTGNIGPNAFKILEAAGIRVVTGLFGKVSEIIEEFRTGVMKPAQEATVQSKFGAPKSGEKKR